MPIASSILRIYFEHGRQLIPISFDEPSPLKRPLHKAWTTRQYPPDEIQDYATKGFNLGWCLTPSDVVIDVDVRNGGLEGMSRLLEDFQRHDPTIEDLGDIFPTVKTGGGGWHFYGLLPPGVKARNTIEAYGKGVEFKSVGHQVIIPGSVHPSGGVYEFDDFSPTTGPATLLPDWLVAKVKRDSQALAPSHLLASGGAELTPAQLADMLADIPATEYSTNEEWMPLMAAAHEATGGAGLEAFIAWSLSDESFIGHDYIIRHRWNSFTPGQAGNIGAGTLYKEVVRHGGQLPPMTTDSPVMQGFNDLPPAEPYVPPPPDAPIIRHADHARIDQEIIALNPMSKPHEIKAVLAQVALTDPLDQGSYLAAIKANTGRPVADLKKAMARVAADDSTLDDVALDVTTYLLDNKFQSGDHLMHGADQRFWRYNGTHWELVQNNIIENLVLKASFQHIKKNPHLHINLAPLMIQSEKILRARSARGQNLLEATNGRPPIVNTRNCEVWVDSDTGLVTTVPHSPGSYLTSCLNTNFDPHATCPMFTTALRQMFMYSPEPEDIIRHLWEVIGYIIQPRKDLATWVLFHGTGANGKTVVINVLTELLGEAALNKSIEELDTKRNNHALADLPNKLCVIDEDLDARITLPDATLKKISESKKLMANPKGQATFSFMNTAIILFASNEYPKIKDLSEGMRRRAHVFDFNRTFRVHEQDPGLTKRIIDNELGGVLVEALRGFLRLRQRGGWQVPRGCINAHQRWLTTSNTTSEFVSDMLVPAPGHFTGFSEVYAVYRVWCIENGYEHPITKPHFRKALVALGHVIDHGAKNKVIVRNVKVNTTGHNFGGN